MGKTYYWVFVALAVMAIAAAIYFSGAEKTVLSSSCIVTYQGTKQKATTRTTVDEFVKKVGNPTALPGNLLGLDESVIETGTGDPLLYAIDDAIVPGSTYLRNGDVVSTVNGASRKEHTVKIIKEGRVGFTRIGNGPVVSVASAGRDPIVTTVKGEKSGIVVSKKETLIGIKPEVLYREYRNDKNKVVALTFDDGPNPGETGKILAILKKENAKATFFMIGTNVEKYPVLAKKVSDSGNQVALHSYHHVSLTTKSFATIKNEILKGKAVILKATGKVPTWMRPPYGAVDGTVYDAIKNANLGVAFWNVDTIDWRRPGKQRIINRAVFGMSPGVVILMHDGAGNRSQTVKALPGIIGEYRDAGYRFVTIEEYFELLSNK
ncbi:MAG: polysaccharide deacetylase family protein [Coriobacteriia bacterium]|nr:polysaccharide deacetylase family protein [Coriobacteriia bacterium]